MQSPALIGWQNLHLTIFIAMLTEPTHLPLVPDQSSESASLPLSYQYSADKGNADAQTAVAQVLNFGTYGVERDHKQV